MKVPDTEEELRWSLNRFLANAAKKHNPARIIIILDGINRLKCEGMPDGSLHWLPTELPPCVRFMVSTVEFERGPRGVQSLQEHRTFIELTRRVCPLLRIDPMNQSVRSQVITDFGLMNDATFTLTEGQQFKIISSPATQQPMYLRSLLQAIRLASSLTTSTIDQLLETFLFCSTAHELVDKTLNMCCQSVFPNQTDPEDKARSEILDKIFTIVYVSRTGLTEKEIMDIIRMVTSIQLEETLATKLLFILKEFSMIVDEMHSFSHEIYREVVYDKYICSRESLIRWHQLMARYFGQLETGDRKLVALPYHLEVAGSWSKVKNCLTDINMFQKWWTPEFKSDFIKFWSSLTKINPKEPDEGHSSKANTGHHSRKDAHDGGGATRPSYDLVEEYVKSLDEYRIKEHPSDEKVAEIILLIGDFLLEFATLGHEANADVPNIIHPYIPCDDLEAIGVPYIKVDEQGRSVLCYPDVFQKDIFEKNQGGDADGGPASDVPSKAVDVMDERTTYFFHRWMWVQFPFIALGNCNTRYTEGIVMAQKREFGNDTLRNSLEDGRASKSQGGDKTGAHGMSRSFSMDAFKLPEIKFNRKAARSHSRKPPDGVDEATAAADKVSQRMDALHDDIQNDREEYDFVCQMKAGLKKRLAELSGSLEELKRSAESCHQFDDSLAEATRREQEASGKYESVKLLNKNLKRLSDMCTRHPPNVPALILEVEAKINQDVFLLAEIKKRLWEQKFEHQMHTSNYRIMQFLSHKGEKMHKELIDCRIKMKIGLTIQASEDERRLASASGGRSSGKTGKQPKSITNGSKEETHQEEEQVVQRSEESWDEMWSIISSRTGITEPDIFFQRLSNGYGLKEQIESLKKGADARVEALNIEVVNVEMELEKARQEASESGGSSNKEQIAELTKKTLQEKHWKEKAENSEQLEQNVVGGLNHLGELLGIPAREEDSSVTDLLRDIEAVLDTLMDEREKQLQSQTQNQSGIETSTSRVIANRETPASPEINRSPELDFVLARYESQKPRTFHKLPSRPTTDPILTNREEDTDEDEGMWDRAFAKSASMKTLRKQERMQGRTTKGADTKPLP